MIMHGIHILYYIDHLADTGIESSTKIEFKQRISIALGAAKGSSNGIYWRCTRPNENWQIVELRTGFLTNAGLCHLHGLRPPLVHNNFKTANVLVDSNYVAKVSDAGVSKLLEMIEEAGPSHMSSANVFQDPE